MALFLLVAGCKHKPSSSQAPPKDKHEACDRFAHKMMGMAARGVIVALGDDPVAKACFEKHPDSPSSCMTPGEAADFEQKTGELASECEGWDDETVKCVNDDVPTAKCRELLEAAMDKEPAEAPAPAGPKVDWTAALAAEPLDVQIVGDAVIAVLRDRVAAWDAKTGAARWSTPFAEKIGALSESWLVPFGKVVLVGDGHGFVIALDVATGKEAWRADSMIDAEAGHSAVLAAGLAPGGGVRLVIEDGKILSLTVDKGKPKVALWCDLPSMVAVGGMRIAADGATYVATGERIFLVSPAGKLTAQLRTTDDTGTIGELGFADPAGKRIAFVLDESKLVVLDPAACAAAGVSRLSEKVEADEDEDLHAPPDGCVVRTMRVPDANADAPVAYGDALLAVGDSERMFRFDDADRETWRAGSGEMKVLAAPDKDLVLFLSAKADAPARLEGYGPKDGKIRWRTPLPFGDGSRQPAFLVRTGDVTVVADEQHLARVTL